MSANLIAQRLNETATFQPGSRGTYPAIVVGGIRVLAWVDDNGFARVRVETDGGFADPAILMHEDGTVAVAVEVDGDVVFTRC